VGGPALVEDVGVVPVGGDRGHRGDQIGQGKQAAPGLAPMAVEATSIRVLLVGLAAGCAIPGGGDAAASLSVTPTLGRTSGSWPGRTHGRFRRNHGEARDTGRSSTTGARRGSLGRCTDEQGLGPPLPLLRARYRCHSGHHPRPHPAALPGSVTPNPSVLTSDVVGNARPGPGWAVAQPGPRGRQPTPRGGAESVERTRPSTYKERKQRRWCYLPTEGWSTGGRAQELRPRPRPGPLIRRGG
jgi:hypothetical protein